MIETPISSQGTITTDAKWTILTANDTQCHALNYSEDELKSKNILDLFAEPFKSMFLALPQQSDAVLICGTIVFMLMLDQSLEKRQ